MATGRQETRDRRLAMLQQLLDDVERNTGTRTFNEDHEKQQRVAMYITLAAGFDIPDPAVER